MRWLLGVCLFVCHEQKLQITSFCKWFEMHMTYNRHRPMDTIKRIATNGFFHIFNCQTDSILQYQMNECYNFDFPTDFRLDASIFTFTAWFFFNSIVCRCRFRLEQQKHLFDQSIVYFKFEYSIDSKLTNFKTTLNREELCVFINFWIKSIDDNVSCKCTCCWSCCDVRLSKLDSHPVATERPHKNSIGAQIILLKFEKLIGSFRNSSCCCCCCCHSIMFVNMYSYFWFAVLL